MRLRIAHGVEERFGIPVEHSGDDTVADFVERGFEARMIGEFGTADQAGDRAIGALIAPFAEKEKDEHHRSGAKIARFRRSRKIFLDLAQKERKHFVASARSFFERAFR
nr:hypothetical protein [Methylosinus sp. R-45379]